MLKEYLHLVYLWLGQWRGLRPYAVIEQAPPQSRCDVEKPSLEVAHVSSIESPIFGSKGNDSCPEIFGCHMLVDAGTDIVAFPDVEHRLLPFRISRGV